MAVNLYCKKCGSPITEEICPNCNFNNGTEEVKEETTYPELECKEANISFWLVVFPLFFTFAFGGTGIATILTSSLIRSEIPEGAPNVLLAVGIPFLIVGIVALIIAMIPVIRTITLKTKGEKVTGTVIGYKNDSLFINGAAAQIVNILIDTDEGPKCLPYQLSKTSKPYVIDDRVELLVYKNTYLIIDK